MAVTILQARLCECGCGQETRPAAQTNRRRGMVRGQPVRFAYNHHNRGANHPSWAGGRRRHNEGYILVWAPDSPMSDNDGYVLEHRLVAARTLGVAALPKGMVVHHENNVKDDNRPENLGLFANQALHKKWHNLLNYSKEIPDW